MLTDKKKASNKKYRENAIKNGKIKRITIDTDVNTLDFINDFCAMSKISKPELLRRIAAKIDDGSLYTFLDIDVGAAKTAENKNGVES